MSDTKSVSLVISGRVQGVFYRAWTKERAEALGVAGWVRNREDGRVEAAFTGPADAVDALVDACRQGPPAARVEDLAVEDGAAVEGSAFTVID